MPLFLMGVKYANALNNKKLGYRDSAKRRSRKTRPNTKGGW